MALLHHGRRIRRIGEADRLLRHRSADPVAAVDDRLAALKVASGDRLAMLTRLVARTPGRAGHIRWPTDHADHDVRARAPATMADLLAL